MGGYRDGSGEKYHWHRDGGCEWCKGTGDLTIVRDKLEKRKVVAVESQLANPKNALALKPEQYELFQR